MPSQYPFAEVKKNLDIADAHILPLASSIEAVSIGGTNFITNNSGVHSGECLEPVLLRAVPAMPDTPDALVLSRLTRSATSATPRERNSPRAGRIGRPVSELATLGTLPCGNGEVCVRSPNHSRLRAYGRPDTRRLRRGQL
jgi:hypothetical protein